ncbi:TetR/AcrR family transcriptional regulator [Amycolatopsis pithecellobii]|uniref:TetR family transcriptional regulator n=1 Tax=Amycolatopsis pithecellobii TaxID=664692 RepID=A0A6N7ZAG0_9PSEU|nr:TetR/AcrR family transcriptional regulator [Amycolatopsis pithecellobii]MTD58731.1 TetR family transcriptional regulator [Amycolatopsis pithecellobii]
MTAIRTARDRARAELTQEIKKAARRQLAEVGAQGLSLRAVARELGMVSSALYRYFPSRDHLLTALIIDAYNAIGEAVEKADKPAENPRLRWHICWAAARAWARKHPHEYALIYGSPIPGYQAPQETVGPAARVALALIAIASAWSLRPAFPGRPMSPKLEEQAREVNDIIGSDLLPDELSRLIIAWTQLFGTISFELFGQYANTLEPADYLFTYTADQLADFVGITGRDG